jgi:hypothetical protein
MFSITDFGHSDITVSLRVIRCTLMKRCSYSVLYRNLNRLFGLILYTVIAIFGFMDFIIESFMGIVYK